MALKAYVVKEGPMAVIVFAGNSRKAIDNYYDMAFEVQGMDEVEAIRKPELDKFAELGEVPPYDMVQAGFNLKCSGCRDEYNTDHYLSDYCEINGGIFCFSCAESIKCGSCGHPDSDEFCPECGEFFKNWVAKK